MKRVLKKAIDRFNNSKNKNLFLGVISFAESSFFPIPPDIFLMALLSKDARRWMFLATITTVSSVFGGLFGYAIGFFFFSSIGEGLISFYGLEAEFEKLRIIFQENTFISLFIAALTPIPYKVFTISGGFFGVSIFNFLIASILGRGIRFFAVAFLFRRFGENIKFFINKYFNLLTLIVSLILVLYIVFR
ncbi:DedA family protein [Candidatus Nomurabacteria bacterium]|nr:DedA family protein [Candidatus Nomurabacteria bacterium]